MSLRVADAPGADFVARADEGNQTVTIKANQRSATHEVPTVSDDTDEPSGPVTVTVRSGSGYRVGAPSSARVPVRDDDPTTVRFGTGEVTFGDGTDYTVGTPATASVAVADDDATEVTLTGTATAIVEDGGTKTLTHRDEAAVGHGLVGVDPHVSRPRARAGPWRRRRCAR